MLCEKGVWCMANLRKKVSTQVSLKMLTQVDIFWRKKIENYKIPKHFGTVTFVIT